MGWWKEFSFGRDDETTALFFSSFLGWRRRRSFEKKVPDIHAIISRTKDAPPPAPRPGNCVFPRHHRPPTTPRRSRANNYPFFSIPAHPSGPLRARPRHAPLSALRTGGPTQTLLTPPPYVHMIWLPILTSLGLFLFASTLHPVMSASPLVGYDSDRVVADPKSSVAGAHFPVVCVSIMTSVYCHDYGRMGWALLGSMLLAFDLGYVLRTQRILAESGGVGGGVASPRAARARTCSRMRSRTRWRAAAVARTTTTPEEVVVVGVALPPSSNTRPSVSRSRCRGGTPSP